MRNYPWDGPIRTAGQDLRSTELPWWYAPAWILAQLPILTTVTIVAALAFSVWALMRQRRSLFGREVAFMAPVFSQAFVLPLAIVLSGATLYDGIRHLLFMIPALVAIGSIAIMQLERYVRNRHPEVGKLVGIYAVIVVLASAWATIRWMPYSYAFINPIAGSNNPQRDWELDYWGLSAFEGVDRLRQQNLELVGVLPTEETAVLFGGGSAASIDEAAKEAPYGLYVFKRGEVSVGECQSLFTVERDGQVLGEGARCLPE